MSDSNNNPYGYHLMRSTPDNDDATIDNERKKNGSVGKLTRDESSDSLARFGMELCGSTDDEDDAFMSDDVSLTSQNAMQAKRSFHNNRKYAKSRVRSTSHYSSQSNRSSVSSRASRNRKSRHKKVAPNVKVSPQHIDSFVKDDVIHENEEVTSYTRCNSHPAFQNKSLMEQRRSRLVRRRSAITYTSTYRTLSVPPRLTPIRPSLGSLVISTTPSFASVASVPDVSCYGHSRSHGRHRTSWSNLITCLAHKKENGYKITQTELLIRKCLEKAIQKAGYNMNELAISNSPCSSPLAVRKMEPKYKVDWTESSVIGEHIWAPSNQTGDLCYVGEASCKKSGPRKKCSACHIIVHDNCLDQLDKISFQCKVSYREARNLRENLVVRHHWVHRRRQEGKCKHCGKAFEKRFGFRDSKILAISCSWCKEAYHNKASCFTIQKIQEACTLGVHARIIVPPTWIVKWTARGKSLRNRSKKKRGSGILRKKSSRDCRQKLFSIRPLPEHTPYLSPTIVFINPKSGGNQGVKILQTFQWLLNQRQVFNLSDGGPKEALEMFRKVPNLRILACGGDGTVGWILSTLDELNLSRYPPVAILPLGTGNDLSRTLNWGSGYTDEPISKILQYVEEGKVVQVDRWKLNVQPNPDAKVDEEEPSAASEGVDQPPLSVVNNYFSLGADAEVVLEFHESREARPQKFNSRIGNKIFYARTGVTDYLTAKHKNLGKCVTVVCDGKNITSKIQALKPVCLVFLNIPRYSAGTVPWGHPTERSEFEPQRHDDKLIEVLALTSNQLGLLYVGGHGERLSQCREAVITTNRPFPVQIDGEPCRLNPSIIKISFHNQANMIQKTKRGTAPLIPDMYVNEQLKVCINTISLENYEKYNGDRAKLRTLSKPSHTTVVLPDADLESIRISIERMQQQQDMEKADSSTDCYTFLHLSSGDRFYRIDRTQESLLLVREVLTNGEIFVLDCTATPTAQTSTETSDLNPSDEANRFPRSPHVDKMTVIRRRIVSDSTASSAASGYITDHSLSPTFEEKARSQTNQFQYLPTIEPQSSHGDVTDGKIPTVRSTSNPVNDDVTNVSTPFKNGVAVSNAPDIEKSQTSIAYGDRTDEVKHNSLPASLTKRESHQAIKARPLSDSSHDVTTDGDVINNSSTSQHCDITKSKPGGSSQPESSPDKSQETVPALCENLPSNVDPEAEGALSSITTTTTVSETSPPQKTDDSMKPESVTTSASDPTPGNDQKSKESRKENGTHEESNNSTDAKSSQIQEVDSQKNASGKNHHSTDEGTSKGEKSPSRGQADSVTDSEGSSVVSGAMNSESSEDRNEESHDSFTIENPLSRNNDNRTTISSIPSPKRQHDFTKPRANTTTAGLPLSIFVKTQPSGPPEPLASPAKRRANTVKDVSPKGRSLTLNQYVTTIDDAVDSEQTKLNKQYADSAKRGDLYKLQMALEYGADPMSLDGDGTSALHNAARFNHPEVVQYLVDNGPSEILNLQDLDRKQTALHKAAWFGHKKVCEILVRSGASLISVDYKGMTPLQRAEQAEDTRLVAFLSQEALKRMDMDQETKL